MKEAIAAFDGTVIVVSHDRQFLDGLVSKVYAFGQGRVREHIGGIYDWLIQHTLATIPATEPAPAIKSTEPAPKPEANKGLSWAEQKAVARKRRQLEKAVAEAEAAMTELEAAIKILEQQMATPQGASDTSLYERHSRLKQQLEKAEEEWLTASEELTTNIN